VTEGGDADMKRAIIQSHFVSDIGARAPRRLT